MNQNFERPYTEDDVRKNYMLRHIASMYLFSRPRAQLGNRKFSDIRRAYVSDWGGTLSDPDVAYLLNRMVADPEVTDEIPEPGVERRRRQQFIGMDAKVHLPFAKAVGGFLIHQTAPGSAHFTIWRAPLDPGDRWGSEPAQDGQARLEDLNVKVRCKFPSWLRNPRLLDAAEAALVMEADPRVRHCPHCAKLSKESPSV